MPAPTRFRIGLVQMRCATDPAANVDAAVAGIREAAARGAQGRLPARAVPHAVLLPARGRDAVRPGRADPGPDHRAPRRRRARAGRRRRRVAVRAARGGRLPQHRRRPRRRRPACSASTARCTSPTIRSTTRSSTSRRATSASPRSTPRFGRIGTLVCWDQWYPGGRAADRAAGADVLFYPTAIGWHPEREGRVRRGAGDGVADDPARARHRQRRLRRGGQPRRPRGSRPTAASSSGAARSSAIRSASILAEASARRGGDPGRRVRPRRTRRRSAATGRSCATAASTPTAPITQRLLDA